MKQVIKGHNKVLYNCFICGKPLNFFDYCEADDMCSRCRSIFSERSDYVNKDGSNKIDAILLEKFKTQGR